jgi:hypothetical protein
MFRKAEWLVAAALVLPTAGCIESMDSGNAAPSYGYGYGNGYYSSGYYAAPQAYYSPPVVYSQTTTRYVPVPTPVPAPARQADRGNDHRWDGHHDEPHHVDRQPAPPSPPPATQSNGSGGSGNHHDGSRDTNRDHNGDGKPDRRS